MNVGNNFKGSVTQKGFWVLAKKSLGIQKYCMGQWARVKIGKCGKNHFNSRVVIIVVVCPNQPVVKSENSVDNSGKNTETLVTSCVFVHINRKSFLLCTMIVGSLM